MHLSDTIRSVKTPVSLRSRRKSETLLLVDDNPVLLAVLKAVLTREAYDVIAVASPDLALKVAARNSFTMLITDFQMPQMNGFDLACEVTASRRALPVIVMSGSDPIELPIARIAERRWKFMPKPIDREMLLRTIDSECLGWAYRVGI